MKARLDFKKAAPAGATAVGALHTFRITATSNWHLCQSMAPAE